MNLGTIVSVKPGHTIPKAYLEKLCATHTTRLGFAAADDDAPGQVGYVTVGEDKDWHSFVEEMCKAYAKSTCVFHFGTYSKTTSDLEEQPYALIADGEHVLLSAMLEGDFPGYAGGEYNNEFNLVRDFLSEAAKELYQQAKEDIPEMMKLASQPIFRRSIKGVLAPRGAVMFIPGIGEPFMFSENIMGEEPGRTGSVFDWGFTTRSLGYTEKPVEEPKVEAAPATMSKAERLAAAFAKPAPEVTKNGATTVLHAPKASVPVVKSDTALPTQLTVKCPEEFKGKEREQWIRQNVVKGHQFKADWKNNRAYRKFEIKETSPLYATFKEAAAAADKQEVRQTPDQPLPKAPPGIEPGPLPVISPTAKAHVMGLINDEVLIVHPGQFEALQKPFEALTEQLTINPDTPLFWPFDGYIKLCQHNVHTAACLMEEFRRRILKDHPEIVNHMMEKMTRPEPTAKAPLTKAERLAAAFNKAA